MSMGDKATLILIRNNQKRKIQLLCDFFFHVLLLVGLVSLTAGIRSSHCLSCIGSGSKSLVTCTGKGGYPGIHRKVVLT